MAKDKKVVSIGEKRSQHKKEENLPKEEPVKEEQKSASEPVYCSFCGR